MIVAKNIKSVLNPKQEQFCHAYVSSDQFWNGTQAYLKVYQCSLTTARTQASIALTNPNIFGRISELLDEAWFNDTNADKQLLFCMNQFADLPLKLQAIREYNRIRGRLTKNLNVNLDKHSLSSLFEWENISN